MREAVLHFIWLGQKFPHRDLISVLGLSIKVVDKGKLNSLSGPDFLFAKVRLDDQEWVGHIELHVKASDWYIHRHHKDAAYDNVILHVVWEADAVITRKDRSVIPTLALSNYISEDDVAKYQDNFKSNKNRSLNCEGSIGSIGDEILNPWKDQLFKNRLRQRTRLIQEWLQGAAQDWEQVFMMLLLKSFGLNINGAAFLKLGKAIPFKIVRKNAGDPFLLESIFYGMAGMLNRVDLPDPYYLELKEAYAFLKVKYNLPDEVYHKPEFFSLRPYNFPTIRLSQIANLYHKHPALFALVIEATTLKSLRSLLKAQAGPYWDTHFVFGKTTPPSPKKMSSHFTDLLILNSVLPIRFSYESSKGSLDINRLNSWAKEIKAEGNKIVRLFQTHGVSSFNAYDSQALVELYNQYCIKNKCLQCAVGKYLLYGK
ncbi:MAG: DUF2851 family protein [Eudoraea sp.]|nr:DUF2851 family protein [Eudoraea sp.]